MYQLTHWMSSSICKILIPSLDLGLTGCVLWLPNVNASMSLYHQLSHSLSSKICWIFMPELNLCLGLAHQVLEFITSIIPGVLYNLTDVNTCTESRSWTRWPSVAWELEVGVDDLSCPYYKNTRSQWPKLGQGQHNHLPTDTQIQVLAYTQSVSQLLI